KRTDGFNLAFLDIMACGLGAVILVFILVKQNFEEAPTEVGKLQEDIATLEQAQSQAAKTLSAVRTELAREDSSLQQSSQELDAQQSALANQQASVQQAEQALDELKSSIVEIEVPERQDLVETNQVNEENYLLGLKVTGRKIGILVDMSASMTNEKLIDIILTKSRSQQAKQTAAKWVRTRNVVKWLLARLPANSEVVVVAFSKDAQILGTNAMQTASPETVSKIMQDLNSLIPQGGTNLQKGLNTINQFAPSNLYVITDGLPTLGESQYRSLNPFNKCNSLTGNAQTISGECRKRLFQQTIQESHRQGTQVDVILLPLEGDPDAVNQYWLWAAATGGLLISPASNWP
ncbi:MAG TPA: VWA domain-containing protein, partial [Methylophaga sp.]|nr:VWA domain-containing protein [Methylophaga sp.]